MEEIKLWTIVCKPDEKPRAAPVARITETDSEQLLEEVLAGSPDILMPDAEIEGQETRLSAEAESFRTQDFK